jgi:Cu/Zn superoxide dismutase
VKYYRLGGGAGESRRLTATMGIYPNDATTNSAPGGFIKMKFDANDGEIKMDMYLYGMTANCSTDNSANDGCGVHIHTGQVCDENDTIAGHFWTPTSEPDPWQGARYNSDGSGRVRMRLTIPGGNGFSVEDNEQHAVVVHDASGARIACGILYSYYSN